MSDSRDGEAGFFGIPAELKLAGAAFLVLILAGFPLALGLWLRRGVGFQSINAGELGDFYTYLQAAEYFPGGEPVFNLLTSYLFLHLLLILTAAALIILMWFLLRNYGWIGAFPFLLVAGLISLQVNLLDSEIVNSIASSLGLGSGSGFASIQPEAHFVPAILAGALILVVALMALGWSIVKDREFDNTKFFWLTVTVVISLGALYLLSAQSVSITSFLTPHGWTPFFRRLIAHLIPEFLLGIVLLTALTAWFESLRKEDRRSGFLVVITALLGGVTLLSLLVSELFLLPAPQVIEPPQLSNIISSQSPISTHTSIAPDGSILIYEVEYSKYDNEDLNRLFEAYHQAPIPSSNVVVRERIIEIAQSPLVSNLDFIYRYQKYLGPDIHSRGLRRSSYRLRAAALTSAETYKWLELHRKHATWLFADLLLLEQLVVTGQKDNARDFAAEIDYRIRRMHEGIGVFNWLPDLSQHMKPDVDEITKFRELSEQIRALEPYDGKERSLTVYLRDSDGNPVSGFPIGLGESVHFEVEEITSLNSSTEKGLRLEKEVQPITMLASFRLTDGAGKAEFKGLFPTAYSVSAVSGLLGTGKRQPMFVTLDSHLPRELPPGETDVHLTLQSPGSFRVVKTGEQSYSLELDPPSDGAADVKHLKAWRENPPLQTLSLDSPTRAELATLYNYPDNNNPDLSLSELVLIKRDDSGRPQQFWVWHGVKQGGSGSGGAGVEQSNGDGGE